MKILRKPNDTCALSPLMVNVGESISFAAKCFYWEGGSALLYPTPVGIPLGIAASAILILSAIAFVKGRALRRYSPLETIVLETIVTEAEPGVPLPLVEVGVVRLRSNLILVYFLYNGCKCHRKWDPSKIVYGNPASPFSKGMYLSGI